MAGRPEVFCETRPSLKRASERKHAQHDECEGLDGEHDAVPLVYVKIDREALSSSFL